MTLQCFQRCFANRFSYLCRRQRHNDDNKNTKYLFVIKRTRFAMQISLELCECWFFFFSCLAILLNSGLSRQYLFSVNKIFFLSFLKCKIFLVSIYPHAIYKTEIKEFVDFITIEFLKKHFNFICVCVEFIFWFPAAINLF